METNERLDAVEPDIQDLIARWAGESKRLLVALPGVLAKLDDLAAETDGLRQRLAELEHENQALRQSREELAETFTKLKALIAGTTAFDTATAFEAQRPRASKLPAPGPEPTPTPETSATEGPPSGSPPLDQERAVAPQPVSAEPSPRFASREDKSATAKPDEPAPLPAKVRFASVFRPPSRA
ncbi:MAG TPA: hypothetical protein VLG10_00380 [Methylomirabilota bacterium]|nr:hypothetical protein [Methylomirabilota bacterium]